MEGLLAQQPSFAVFDELYSTVVQGEKFVGLRLQGVLEPSLFYLLLSEIEH